MSSAVAARFGRLRNQQDSGAALILAMIVVLVVGAGLTAALSFTGVGLTLAPSVRDDRNESNYIQGAVEGAISQIRTSSEAGRLEADALIKCPTYKPTLPSVELAGVNKPSTKKFEVTCTGLDPGSSGGDDVPRFAIHALGPNGIKQTGTAQLYVTGPIYSNGVVEVTKNSASILANGTITAEGKCLGDVSTTDRLGLNCETGSGSTIGDDPKYKSAIDGASSFKFADVRAASVNGPVTCSGDTAEFPAGYYSMKPSDLATAAGCAAKAAWHFAPGRYYFDYAGIWDLGSTKVVGGTITTASSTTSAWTSTKPLGGACDDTKPGVQFVFGGSSQIYTKSSSGAPTVGGIELCGPTVAQNWNGKPQRIVLYGLTSNNDVGGGSSGTSTLQATTLLPPQSSTDSTTTAKFDAPEKGVIIGGGSATSTLTKDRIQATLAHRPLAANPALPSLTTVTSVVLTSAHEAKAAGQAFVRISAPTVPEFTVNFPKNDDCNTGCPVDITSMLPASALNAATLLTLNVTQGVNALANGGNASVDGFKIDVTYGTPALAAQACAAPCTYFFESDNNPNVFMHGTVYTPDARWKVSVHNSGETLFRRGIVMKDIDIDSSESSKQESSPFQLPSGTPNGRLVLFLGKVDDVVKVRACARYTDYVAAPNGTTSAYTGWSVAVPHWQVLRTPSAQTAACP